MIRLAEKRQKGSLSLIIPRFITHFFIEADRLQHVSTVCMRTEQAMMRHANKFYCSDVRDTVSEKK